MPLGGLETHNPNHRTTPVLHPLTIYLLSRHFDPTRQWIEMRVIKELLGVRASSNVSRLIG